MRTKTLTRVVVALTFAAAAPVITVPPARAGLTAEQQCQKARYFAAAKYAQCQDKTMGLFFAGGDPGKMETALSNCRVKYTGTWEKLQKKAAGTGSTCDSPRFVDNGPRTITDRLTNLVWEKKNDFNGTQDKDNVRNFGGALGEAAFYASQCFDARCDWRLPTRAELQTILSEPFTCTTSPCIDPVFAPTIANFYWTSTVDAVDPTLAWVVNFGSGLVGNASLTDLWSYRAVAGGL